MRSNDLFIDIDSGRQILMTNAGCVACADNMHYSDDDDFAINVFVSIGLVQIIDSRQNIFHEWIDAANRPLYKTRQSGQVWHLGPLLPENRAVNTRP